jgi:hypothetical protein
MKGFMITAAALLALAAGAVAGAGELGSGAWRDEVDHTETWEQAIAAIDWSKGVIPLSDASIIIEVNSTDGDAGFQVFVDGEGWRSVRVFEPHGRKILHAMVGGGIRRIGGGTELFLESEEPEYEDLEELEDLIELLREGEYRFLARTTGHEWAVGSAELTHVVPAGPVLTEPLPEPGEDCATDVPVDGAVISWEPVTTTIWGEDEITIVAYQVIVGDEESGMELLVTVDAGTTAMTVPEEFLSPDTEYVFEVLAIEEGGNQTITESCFVTE